MLLSCFRDGCDWLFDELHKCDVPLLIFSAGVGDIIQEVLKQQYTVYDNMKIVSNFMDFDKEVKLSWLVVIFFFTFGVFVL